MGCERTWQYMMLVIDGAATKQNERDMLLHIGNCKHCSATWKALQETTLFIPETAEEPATDIVDHVMNRLSVRTHQSERCEATFSGFVLISFVLLFTGAYSLLSEFLYSAGQGLFQFLTSSLSFLSTAISFAYRGLLYLFGNSNVQTVILISALFVVLMLFAGAYAGIKKIQPSENRSFHSSII